MLINELLNLEERINLAKLIQKYKPKSLKSKAKAATPKSPRTSAAPKRKITPKAKPVAASRPPKPFNTPKGLVKSAGPKQTRTLDVNTNMQVNSFLKPLPQNVISPRGSADMDLYRKMEFTKDQAHQHGIESDMSNREIDSKSRGS